MSAPFFKPLVCQDNKFILSFLVKLFPILLTMVLVNQVKLEYNHLIWFGALQVDLKADQEVLWNSISSPHHLSRKLIQKRAKIFQEPTQ